MAFKLESEYKPAGGQPQAIKELVQGFAKNKKQTLLGITGSGKTFVMANVIASLGKPTLVLAHNKTLAAQLYTEFKELFPHNAVEYFISYYDYYQPESYMPTTDLYIEKEATINEQIERMRLSTVASLLSRKDVIVVASISCIYGLGNPQDYAQMSLTLKAGERVKRQELLRRLVEMQYERGSGLEPGKFRVMGETIDLMPAYKDTVLRIELGKDGVKSLSEMHKVTGQKIASIETYHLFPARQYVVPEEKHEKAIEQIKAELEEHLPSLPPLEAERLRRRVKYDIEMIEEMGYCTGIENYSRHFDGRKVGEPPYVLLDYFPEDFLMIIDESHQTLPQARAMYNGDLSRKRNLVDFGFRLPCAYDNRPLKFEEFEKHLRQVLFVSATPAEYELAKSGHVAELIIRPTGLLDPTVEVMPVKGQIDDLLSRIAQTVKRDERVLITTLTKRSAEDLTEFLAREGVRARYMHSEIDSLERIELIRQLRAKEFDVLVGINLLREGLDLPEVSLVAILDADKEGFLRDERSLIQTIGRASRNINGQVVLYADTTTRSMKAAIEKTRKRREEQIAFNAKNKIVPQTIIKKVAEKEGMIRGLKHLPRVELERKMIELEAQMRKAADELDFEKAIELRDAMQQIQEQLK